MYRLILLILSLFVMLAGCSGVQTFPNVARAGDTVSIAMGWQKQFNRSNTTVTIIPSVGESIVYLPKDPSVRAIINLYPDPVSNIVVGTALENNSYFKSGYTYGSLINLNYTSGDMEWWQTTAFIDLPVSLPDGIAAIKLTNDIGETAISTVNVVPGSGEPEEFKVDGNGPLAPTQLASLERASSVEVSLNASTIPYAVEMEFLHVGEVYVVNPSNMKNLLWSDDGSVLKVSLFPASTKKITNIHDFKFYISGIAALDVAQNFQPVVLQSIRAFDINGDDVSGVDVVTESFFN